MPVVRKSCESCMCADTHVLNAAVWLHRHHRHVLHGAIIRGWPHWGLHVPCLQQPRLLHLLGPSSPHQAHPCHDCYSVHQQLPSAQHVLDQPSMASGLGWVLFICVQQFQLKWIKQCDLGISFLFIVIFIAICSGMLAVLLCVFEAGDCLLGYVLFSLLRGCQVMFWVSFAVVLRWCACGISAKQQPDWRFNNCDHYDHQMLRCKALSCNVDTIIPATNLDGMLLVSQARPCLKKTLSGWQCPHQGDGMFMTYHYK